MEIVLIVLLAFGLGWYLSSLWQAAIMTKILKDLGVKVEDLEKLESRLAEEYESKPIGESLNEIEVKIEKHNNQLYAFRVDNDQFLGQGENRDALIERIAEKIMDAKLIIREENGAKFLK